MKRFSILILALFIFTTSLFADVSKNASVFLNAPDNKVIIGFATSVQNAKDAVTATTDFILGNIPLTDQLRFRETTYSDTVFIFYRAIVNSNSNYTLTLELKNPFTYWTESGYGTDIINYTATVKNPTTAAKWDGSNSNTITTTGIPIESNNNNPVSADLESNLRGSATNYVVSGIAQVEIYIPETEISEKKYGQYKTEMTLKLTTTE